MLLRITWLEVTLPGMVKVQIPGIKLTIILDSIEGFIIILIIIIIIVIAIIKKTTTIIAIIKIVRLLKKIIKQYK